MKRLAIAAVSYLVVGALFTLIASEGALFAVGRIYRKVRRA